MSYEVCDMDSYITWPYQVSDYTTVGSHGCIIKCENHPLGLRLFSVYFLNY